jgi:hypothetical protein
MMLGAIARQTPLSLNTNGARYGSYSGGAAAGVW